MSSQDTKQAIIDSLQAFSVGNLTENALHLFDSIGYTSEKRPADFSGVPSDFMNDYDSAGILNSSKALLDQWQSIYLLFQLTSDEIKTGSQLMLDFGTEKKVNNTIIESYLFFTIELTAGYYTRTQLSSITREINKLFPMPVMILFRHGDTLTFSIINRRLHKRDESKDVLEKVTLIKAINYSDPHRAHIEILFDLSLDELYRQHGFTNFVELHQAWQKVLDSSELNKRFFSEIANWYFWATQYVTFPKDAGKDKEVRNATSVIRLITRLIFIWFIKEKQLVPDDLFDQRKLKQILNYSDANGSTYYKAILQNLFFATLNQEMNTLDKPDNRKFRSRNKLAGGRDPHFNITNLYRYENYFQNPSEALDLFSQIPFLNGGLFECLDKPDKDNPSKILRIDGFSDHADNELYVPDFLFFSEEREVDLNEEYGTKTKRYKVWGLIDILNRYKFTIEENTPIEEEIALDPELLGKVFENLLANYNPETKTTARKQTGSYYTPREIVNYMVDESLIAYLETCLKEKVPSLADMEELPELLREVFAYTEKIHPFNEEEVTALIDAIYDIKVLDPACGSAAFPMGILHKLVFILSKLDPHNELWKKKQLAKAAEIPDITIREKLIENIEELFERNELDYGRKLYLIENCIYGVDIQPIAVQIAKLRFFISLIVDQKVDDSRQNRGILPLPNLETKFVAANTLIGLDRPQQLVLHNPAIDQKEKELDNIRQRHFSARTQRTKQRCRDEDARLRAEIGVLLKNGGFPRETTEKVAHWDPYDQNTSSDFFDPEWMFGILDGFHIVIGNPPWGVQLTMGTKAMLKEKMPEIDSSTPNTFAYFVGVANRISNLNVTFVLPDSILMKDYAKTRKLITPKLFSIDWYQNTSVPEKYRPFVYVEHDVCVVIFNNSHLEKVRCCRHEYDPREKRIIRNEWIAPKSEMIFPEYEYVFNLLLREEDRKIHNKLTKFETIDSFMQCHEGIHTGNSRELLFFDEKRNGYCMPLYFGGRAGDYIANYVSKTSGWYVDYRKKLIDHSRGYYASLRDENIFKYPKIYVTRTGNPFKCFYDEDTYASNNFFSLQFKDYSNNTKGNLLVSLCIINSRLSQYFVRTFPAPRLGNTYVETKIIHLLKIRSPKLSEAVKKDLLPLVSQIVAKKEKDITSDIAELENQIDSLVYKLYGLTEQEIKVVEGASVKGEDGD